MQEDLSTSNIKKPPTGPGCPIAEAVGGSDDLGDGRRGKISLAVM